jgi:hypothetical protein
VRGDELRGQRDGVPILDAGLVPIPRLLEKHRETRMKQRVVPVRVNGRNATAASGFEVAGV